MINRSRMIRSLCIIYAAAVLFVAGCRRETVVSATSTNTTQKTTTIAVPQDLSNAKINTVIAIDNSGAVSKVHIGSKADSDGMVTGDVTTFKRGEPVMISMWLNDSPNGLATSAKLFDSKGKEIAEERKPMKGAKTVTFSFATRKLKPGLYKVKGFWGGNVAGEFDVTVK
jgi:hypothetical protein